MSAPILCLVLGHKPTGDNVLRFDRDGATRIVGDWCVRCNALVIRRLAEPIPLALELKIWPLLLALAPKTKLGDLAGALFDQGWMVDTVEGGRITLAPTPEVLGAVSPAVDEPTTDGAE